MPTTVLAWLLLGAVAASLERWLLRRPGSTLLDGLVLAWVGAAVGGLLSILLGFGDLRGGDLRSMAFAVTGVVVVLGGVRLVRRVGLDDPGGRAD